MQDLLNEVVDKEIETLSRELESLRVKFKELEGHTDNIVKHTRRVILISDREHSAWLDCKDAINSYETIKKEINHE